MLGYKVNIQNLIVFLYYQQQLENEMLKWCHLHIILKNWNYLILNLTRDAKGTHGKNERLLRKRQIHGYIIFRGWKDSLLESQHFSP